VSKAAAAEVLGELPLDVVGKASAVCGDESPGLSVGAALIPMVEGRKNASENAALRRRRRALRATHGSAVPLKAAVERKSAHGLAFHC
jgi:hypothetical protein